MQIYAIFVKTYDGSMKKGEASKFALLLQLEVSQVQHSLTHSLTTRLRSVPVLSTLEENPLTVTKAAVSLILHFKWPVSPILAYLLSAYYLQGFGFLAQSMLKHEVIVKNCVFWVVTPCGSCKNRCSGGTSRLHHQGDKNR
jgi:hypothetical protein